MLSRIIQTARFINDVNTRFNHKNRIVENDAVWLKDRLQGMGPTYIKIGQFVSARRDIFDKIIVDGLKELQDKVTPLEKNVARQIMESSLDTRQFKSIEITPLASASIGQVHRAVLKNGSDVVIKIRKPEIGEIIAQDIDILRLALNCFQLFGVRNIPETREILEDFRTFVLRETDYRIEMENMKQFYTMNKNNELVLIPRSIDEFCSSNVLVMEFVPSQKVEKTKMQLSPKQKSDLAYNLMDIFVNHLIDDGLIHGDPHEGNFGLTGNKVVMYDFGNIITIDNTLRSLMKRFVFEIVVGNIDASINVLREMRVVEIRDEQKLRVYLESYVKYFRTLDYKVFNFSEQEMYGMLPIKFDGVVFRLIRSFGMIEGICKDLDPDFNYNTLFMKYADTLFVDSSFLEYRVKTDVKSVLKLINNLMT